MQIYIKFCNSEGKKAEKSLEMRNFATYLIMYCVECAFIHHFLIFIMQVKIINRSKHELPKYETEQSAGLDLRANLDAPITLKPMERCLVPTGLFMALPKGYEAQVRPRSGLAIKKGVTVLNSPGTIDADYRGEVCVVLINLSSEPFVINDGERIAQMIVSRFEQVEWDDVEVLDETERGAGGFGHTGK